MQSGNKDLAKEILSKGFKDISGANIISEN